MEVWNLEVLVFAYWFVNKLVIPWLTCRTSVELVARRPVHSMTHTRGERGSMHTSELLQGKWLNYYYDYVIISISNFLLQGQFFLWGMIFNVPG